MEYFGTFYVGVLSLEYYVGTFCVEVVSMEYDDSFCVCVVSIEYVGTCCVDVFLWNMLVLAVWMFFYGIITCLPRLRREPPDHKAHCRRVPIHCIPWRPATSTRSGS